MARTGGGPQAERPVDVHPRAGGMGGRDDLVQRIEAAAVDVPRLGAHDRRAVARGELGAQRRWIHEARVVDGDRHQGGGAEAEDAAPRGRWSRGAPR